MNKQLHPMMMIRTAVLAIVLMLPLTGAAQCSASFTYIVNGLDVTFDGTTSPVGSSGTNYYWWFSDNGNNSFIQDPTYTFSAPGTYVVCFSYYDPADQCADSICQSVTVGGCNVDFTWIDSLGYCFFITSSTLGNAGNYSWDFGDGNYSNQQNPSHVYAFPGTYYVCVMAYDSNQVFCDSTCYWVTSQSQVGVMDVNTVQQTLNVAPNPGDDALNVTFTANGAGNVRIMLYDVSGRIAKEETIGLQGAGDVNHKINTSDMAEGVYFVKIEVNGVPAWTKITLTHQ
jgi:hypothetical protein